MLLLSEPEERVVRLRGAQVRGLCMQEVRSEEEALGMFFLGEAGRSTAQHVLNSNSSRSHCVFTVHLEMRGSSDANERAIKSKVRSSAFAIVPMGCRQRSEAPDQQEGTATQ